MRKREFPWIRRWLERFFRLCPKSGRIVAVKKPERLQLLLFPVVGLLALAWFLIRTLPKPSRATYPCQKIAAGLSVAFLTYLAGLLSSLSLFKKLRRRLRSFSRPLVTVCCLALCTAAGLLTIIGIQSMTSEPPMVYADWEPGDAPNTPIGDAKGIFPGRVTWCHAPDATADNPSGYWWQEGNTDEQVVSSMFDASVTGLTGEGDTAAAWQALFRYYNANHGKGSTGYQNGETVVIKINTVNTYMQSKGNGNIDACAETLAALLEQLTGAAGVPQSSIIVYDGGVGTIGSYVYDYVNRSFPQVEFRANMAWGGVQAVQWVDNGITYSSYNITNADARRVVRCLWEADYLVNLALLKKHEDQTAVTLTAKNHFGSVRTCSYLHASINDHIDGMGSYNSLVDLSGHERIGGKTLLYIIDGLWGAPMISGQPVRWNTAPFNGDWPSSLFLSLDPVAIDSVGLDFLNAEFTLWDNGDNYLHEAAQAGNPPSGVVYDPEADGSRLQSLGVHEHWNNPQDKQYSRNLGTGSGIELYVTGQAAPPQTGDTGDVNSSGSVDIVDALMVAQYYVGLDVPGFTAANADVNGDGSISIVDALMIAQYYVGLIDSF